MFHLIGKVVSLAILSISCLLWARAIKKTYDTSDVYQMIAVAIAHAWPAIYVLLN